MQKYWGYSEVDQTGHDNNIGFVESIYDRNTKVINI